MPKSITNQNTADGYTEQGGANLNSVYQSTGGWISLPAQVMAQIQHSSAPNESQGMEQWSEEFVLPSGAHYLQPGIIGVRCRSFTPGNPVAVSAAIFFRDEPAIALGGSGISSPNTGVASLNFQHNDLAVATEPTVDFEDAAALSPANLALVWTVVDDVANTRVKVTPVPSWANPTIFPNSFSNGPSNESLTGAQTAGVFVNKSNNVGVFATNTTDTVFLASQIADTVGYAFNITARGTMNWGPGNAAQDTTLLRATNNPPSGTAIGMQTNNPFTVNDPNGFKVIQATNSSAFTTWFLNTDSQPAFKIFAQGAMTWGVGGSTAPDTELARTAPTTGSGASLLYILGPGGIGYGGANGVGSTVTQGTSLNTNVTLNKICGAINLFTTAPAAGSLFAFTVSNSLVGVDDVVILSLSCSTDTQGDGVICTVTSVKTGSFRVSIYVPLAQASGTRVLNFAIIRSTYT